MPAAAVAAGVSAAAVAAGVSAGAVAAGVPAAAVAAGVSAAAVAGGPVAAAPAVRLGCGHRCLQLCCCNLICQQHTHWAISCTWRVSDERQRLIGSVLLLAAALHWHDIRQ